MSKEQGTTVLINIAHLNVQYLSYKRFFFFFFHPFKTSLGWVLVAGWVAALGVS
jgi:hypothetical protein